MNPFELAPAVRLRSAYLHMHRAVNGRLRPFGVTADQFVVLRFLAEEDGISQKDLVRLCSSDPTTIGRMLELLEDKGCVQRRPDPDDGRSRLVFLTTRGRNLCKRLYDATAPIRQVFENAVEANELQSMLDALQKLADAFAVNPELSPEFRPDESGSLK
jgi:MarR family transcriptional regulator for hemolysin